MKKYPSTVICITFLERCELSQLGKGRLRVLNHCQAGYVLLSWQTLALQHIYNCNSWRMKGPIELNMSYRTCAINHRVFYSKIAILAFTLAHKKGIKTVFQHVNLGGWWLMARVRYVSGDRHSELSCLFAYFYSRCRNDLIKGQRAQMGKKP